MAACFSFRFVDDRLNRRLMALLKRARVEHLVDKDGVLYYSKDNEALVENELIAKVRDGVFSPWQLLCCPKSWTKKYQQYMNQRGIPYQEELIDKELCFLIPGNYRPHSWKLESDLSKNQRIHA